MAAQPDLDLAHLLVRTASTDIAVCIGSRLLSKAENDNIKVLERSEKKKRDPNAPRHLSRSARRAVHVGHTVPCLRDPLRSGVSYS
jgi:hypothetical protein